MQYNDITLLLLNILGVLLHALVKINELKKRKQRFSVMSFVLAEWASMGISVIIGIVAIVCKKEIKQLDAAGNWLGLGFVTLGYMGQSLLYAFMGKAREKLGLEDKDQ